VKNINQDDIIAALGDDDNNPETISDPNWEPLLDTPPFPDYISGHSVFGGASAQALASFYGTDNISFDISYQELPGVSRSFGSFTQAARKMLSAAFMVAFILTLRL
jgi:hypothetical protein